MKSETRYSSIIENVLQSSVFSSSELYSNLLQFLFEKFEQGDVLKESIIAVEFFHKDSTFNTSEQSLVRYHMHKLRKKLEIYYQTEGASDAVRLEIPRGRYELEFKAKKDVVSTMFNWKKLFAYAAVAVSLIILTWMVSRSYHLAMSDPISAHDPLWSSFFANDLPVNVVIGDFFIFEEWDEEQRAFQRVMDYNVDTENEFNAYKERYPGKRVRLMDLGELPHNSIFNIKALAHVFYSFKKEYAIKMSQFLSPTDLKNHNVIYIGPMKNMRMLRNVLDDSSLGFIYSEEENRSLTIVDASGDTLHHFEGKNLWASDSLKTDYGLVAKVPGFRDEQILLLSGVTYISQIELVNFLSYPENLAGFYKEIKSKTDDNKVPDFFIAIFKVEGYQYTSYKSKIEYFRVLE